MQLVPAEAPINCLDNILGHWSYRAKTLHGSTASIELAAMRHNYQQFWRVVATIQQLFPDRTRIVLVADNQAALQQADLGVAKTSPISDEDAAYVKQEVSALDADFVFADTKSMIADVLTKPLNREGHSLW